MSNHNPFWLLATFALLLSACSQQMANQPKYIPLRPSPFFEDGKSARPLVEGTVARGQLHDDLLLYTGRIGPSSSALSGVLQMGTDAVVRAKGGSVPTGAKIGSGYANVFPIAVTRQVLDRGQERFNIYCSPCHGRLGMGNGMIVQRGYRRPPSLHTERLREAPPGYLFDVISNGFGAMPDYAAQISPQDRWAIIGYIRALQLSQNGSLRDVPAGERSKLAGGGQK